MPSEVEGVDCIVTYPTDITATFERVRGVTCALAEPLHPEDTVVQTMADVSPTKWHLGHTTWFFETFVLEPHEPNFHPVEPLYRYIFNSYYQQVGPQFHRPQRGHLSRPTLAEVNHYRRIIDERVTRLWHQAEDDLRATLASLITVGLHHEQQHQELLLTDIKHVLAQNPLEPAYADGPTEPILRADPDDSFVSIDGGVFPVGATEGRFHFDNERPRHEVLLRSFDLARDLVTAADFQAFMAADGFQRPELWLSDGWDWLRATGTRAPLYWYESEDSWYERTLYGPRPVDMGAPVTHVSFYEADAFARWAGARLPTEFEWEQAFALRGADAPAGSLMGDGHLHPVGRTREGEASMLRDMIGEIWEWTASAYLPYPGYRPAPGAIGEYNGKFMSGQMVLRGGSIATDGDHIRPSYRNFFQPEKQWQFSGIRLARDP